LTRALARMQSELDTVASRVLEVREQNDRIAQVQQDMQVQREHRAPQTGALTAADLEPLHQAIRDLRELAMLTEGERRERLARDRQDRRAAMIKQAFDLVGQRQWHGAERLVTSLETEFPSDHDVAKARNYLNHARLLNEQETLARTVREVEELMHNANWDHAMARAKALVEGFPDNGRARELMHRVQHERDAFHESTVARMFDELRHDIDRRMWRRAFMHAQHLLERFPTHARAEAVRRQLKTLQDNAEIEERQEIEVRIQELIKAQRFDEAIALGEDLIRRYPMSPQAESLDTLLPRLRDLAEHGVEQEAADESFGSGAPIDDEITTVPRSA
jgi:outer membrane protein assembly factor BamD (BamD/ComL family)